MLNRPSTRPLPLPEKIASLLQEARWLLLGVLALYVALILFGYSKADPGWSHAVQLEHVNNPGGRFGAWLSDLLLYLFGLSAWWWVALLGLGLAVGFRRLHKFFGADRRSFVIVVLGFVVVLLASSGLESMRFHSIKATLPLEPGGLIGLELGALIFKYLGFTGGTLLGRRRSGPISACSVPGRSASPTRCTRPPCRPSRSATAPIRCSMWPTWCSSTRPSPATAACCPGPGPKISSVSPRTPAPPPTSCASGSPAMAAGTRPGSWSASPTAPSVPSPWPGCSPVACSRPMAAWRRSASTASPCSAPPSRSAAGGWRATTGATSPICPRWLPRPGTTAGWRPRWAPSRPRWPRAFWHAEVVRVTASDWPEKLRQLCVAKNVRSLLYGEQTEQAAALVGAGISGLKPYDRPVDDWKQELFENTDASFTSTRGGIAETGTLIIWPDARELRLMSLVPPIHFALLDAGKLYDTLFEAMVEQGWSDALPTNALLVSGPSKTADIQVTLAYGAHSPKGIDSPAAGR